MGKILRVSLPVCMAMCFLGGLVARADPMSVFVVRTAASSDDAHEKSSGTVETTTNVVRTGTRPWAGMRFRNVPVPRNGTITKAIISYKARGNDGKPASVTFFGEATNSAKAFSTSAYDISSRSRTTASTAWNPLPAYANDVIYQSVDISTVIQEIIDQPDWASGNHLNVLVRSDLLGERDADAYDSSAASSPLLTLEYTPFSRPVAPNLLYVVTSASNPTAQELKQEEWLKWWAYEVTRIDATASQANFDAAVAINDVAFISGDVTYLALNTKLKNAALGVVTDEPALIDDFALASTAAATGASSFAIASNEHYITSPFSVGSLTLFSSPQLSLELAGTVASEAIMLGSFSNLAQGLVTIEAGGTLVDGTRAAGRRVFLPWSSGSDYNNLNSNGQTLLRRSLEWAAGLQSWWKLNETSGSTAVDSGAHARHGTLNGTTFAAGTTAAKIDTGLNLNGTNTYVSVPHHATLQLTKAVSISGWVCLNSFGVGHDVDIVLRKGDLAPAAYQLCIQDGKVTLHLKNETDGTAAGTIGNTTLLPGEWYHVAGSWDGTTALVYLNGEVDCAPRAVTAPLPSDTRPLYMGGRVDGTDLMTGKIDDVRLYNYALTAEEIFNLRRIDQPRGMRVIKWVETQ